MNAQFPKHWLKRPHFRDSFKINEKHLFFAPKGFIFHFFSPLLPHLPHPVWYQFISQSNLLTDWAVNGLPLVLCNCCNPPIKLDYRYLRCIHILFNLMKSFTVKAFPLHGSLTSLLWFCVLPLGGW